MKQSCTKAFLAASLVCSLAVADDLIGFWDFKDGMDAAEVGTVVNSLGEAVYASDPAQKSAATGRIPTFSASGPGRVVDPVDGQILCDDPWAIDFHYAERATHQGGYFDIPGLADRLSELTAYTIELFIKFDADFDYYDPANTYTFTSKTALYVQSGGSRYKLIAPRDKYKTSGHPNGMSLETYAYGTVKNGTVAMSGDYGDGAWRHVAVVYAETNATTQAGVLSFYVEGALIGELPYANVPGSNLKFRLGTGYMAGTADKTATESTHASLSCLRVTARALEVGDFMILSDYVLPAGTVFALNFDEGVAGEPVLEGNTGVTSVRIHPGSSSCSVAYNLHAACRPHYAETEKKGRTLKWGETPMWKENLCLWFPASSHIPDGAANRQWYGSILTVPASTAAAHNPASWTMEAQVKLERVGAPEAAYKSGHIFGKSDNAGARSGKWSWALACTSAGTLLLRWTERPTDDFTDYEDKSPYYKEVRTEGTYLQDLAWHHVALSYSATAKMFTLYVDGEVVLEQPLLGEEPTTTLFDGPYAYCFGRSTAAGGFEGWMDNIRFTSRVLTPEEFERYTPTSFLLIIK
ncbi:MAG: LamG-like jellyroll fold domain-containing protein [Kiritimatiellia bacterium]